MIYLTVSFSGFIVRSEFITASQSSSDLTWTLRVTVDPLKKMQSSFISLIVYIHNEGEGQMDLNGNMDKGMVEEIFGHTPEVEWVWLKHNPCCCFILCCK